MYLEAISHLEDLYVQPIFCIVFLYSLFSNVKSESDGAIDWLMSCMIIPATAFDQYYLNMASNYNQDQKISLT